jgi:2-haloalkanoic acid dehalogenase type II
MAQPEALAFDMYGTLVDPIAISEQLEGYLAEQAPRVALVWRQKQLEYTFRLTAMERYEDFEWVTRKSLDYALAAAGRALEADQKDALIDQYNDLKRFPDIEPGLERLKEAGHTMVVFSNGTPHIPRNALAPEGPFAGCAFHQRGRIVGSLRVRKPGGKLKVGHRVRPSRKGVGDGRKADRRPRPWRR